MSIPKEYTKIITGKLSFKGDSSKKIKAPKRKREGVSGNVIDARNEDTTKVEHPSQLPGLQEHTGTGRITSSGVTIHGHDTDFMSQLTPGDAIIIIHPSSLQEETKIVRMVLSNVSIGISSPFSSDLISTCSFRYLKAPKDTQREVDQAKQEVSKRHRTEEEAFGTYASQGGQQIVYREKKKGGAYGGYKIVTQKSGKQLSREDLLQLRSKKKSDRHCY
mmetsp:Transcript_18224/g.30563  ORF Transcript_18224/g.30563 Transcript_18224/m.30563 type:complete len:219 (-) Transcript_18224:2369-3025(-)